MEQPDTALFDTVLVSARDSPHTFSTGLLHGGLEVFDGPLVQ